MSENNILLLKQDDFLCKIVNEYEIYEYDNEYVIRIYNKEYLQYKMLINIFNYFEKEKYLPKTIYDSYYFTKKSDCFNNFLLNNKLPNYFRIKEEKNNYIKLVSKKKIKNKLYEIMKYYKYTFEEFIKVLDENNLIDENKKINILQSLLEQGIMTIIWLYIKKGIVIRDIKYENFYIKKTSKDYINFIINLDEYKIKLEGYYLIFGNFENAKSLELVNVEKFPEEDNSIIRSMLNPIYDLEIFINLFKYYMKEDNGINKIIIGEGTDDIIEQNIKNDSELNILFNEMVRSYVKDDKDKLKNDIKMYKNIFINYVNKNILPKICNNKIIIRSQDI